MLRTTFSRTVVGVVLAAALLVPAASADDWARSGLDPAIATALQDHTSAAPESVPLDPAIATAIRDQPTSQPAVLDPAIRTALMEIASSSTRPDDQASARGVGSLPQPIEVASSGGLDWDSVRFGVGAGFVGCCSRSARCSSSGSGGPA